MQHFEIFLTAHPEQLLNDCDLYEQTTVFGDRLHQFILKYDKHSQMSIVDVGIIDLIMSDTAVGRIKLLTKIDVVEAFSMTYRIHDGILIVITWHDMGHF